MPATLMMHMITEGYDESKPNVRHRVLKVRTASLCDDRVLLD